MQNGIKSRVVELLGQVSLYTDKPISLRRFCMVHDINYGALNNALRNEALGIQTVNAFKRAIPELNMNWFLYGEGEVFVPKMSQ